MPTTKRKRVVLIETSDTLLQAVKHDPNRQVYYLHQTGEVFETYEAYAARMSFYRLKQFQCEVTGRSGLDYFQAVESEKQEARTMHARFSEQLKPAILKAVQWQVVGRLDHLVEAVYERFKDRYFKGEKVLIDLSLGKGLGSSENGGKYYAEVAKVYPPSYNADQEARDAHKGSLDDPDSELPHAISGDLNEAAKDANARDDPHLYYYWVSILEPEKEKGATKTATSKGADSDGTVVGSLMEVQCPMMSRDRLCFSKSILRRFIRDCVDRDAAVGSPWTVKTAIARRYGVASEMPEETSKDVENIKKGMIDRRKKHWEEKEGPPTKKQKKLTAQQEERERKEREKAEKQRLAKEEAERIAAEKKKKKPVRYPTEDLDVRLSEKDKKTGMKVKRPVPSTVGVPFSDEPHGTFESFLMIWTFLMSYGQPLHLSTFTLDELEHALRHTVAEPPCSLLAEIHSTLIYNLRTVSFARHAALLSLLQHKEDNGEGDVYGVSIEELTAAMAEIGNNWERVPLRHSEGREGWEEAMVGCLKDTANIVAFPQLRQILTKLLFAPESSEQSSATSSSSRASTPAGDLNLTVIASPAERYYTLPPHDRIAILAFMCGLAVSSKAVRTHIESCEEQLTALRKEKIDVNRQKKQYIEEMQALLGETKEESSSAPAAEPDDDSMIVDASDNASDIAASDGSESGSGSKRVTTKQKELRQKMQTQALAKQREAARAKQASQKQAMAEYRRLDEEVNKLERRLEGIERDFRKLLGVVRVKPLGRDRFYNRVWWFDGMGSASLVGSGGASQYGTGRIFIQGASDFDVELLQQKQQVEDINARRKEEEGEEGMLSSGDWAVFSDIEEIEEFVAWLNPKGHRELALKTAITKWWPHISAGVKRRSADLAVVPVKVPEARRSTRAKTSSNDLMREPYMQWQNRRATNNSS